MRLTIVNNTSGIVSLSSGVSISAGGSVYVDIADEVYNGEVLDSSKREVALWNEIKNLASKGSVSYFPAVKIDGNLASYLKTTDGIQVFLPASATERFVHLVIKVTEAFANGTGAQPTFKFGEDGDDDKFAGATLLASASLGDVFNLMGVLSANKRLIITATKATGNGTGAISVFGLTCV